MYFCVNDFEVGVNDSIFSGNEQQKVCLLLLNYVALLKYTTDYGNQRTVERQENLKTVQHPR